MKWFEWISIIGSIASFIGICINGYQIYKVKNISKAVSHAVAETINELQRNISIADIAKYNEIIKQIQEYMSHSKLELALFRMRELRTILVELRELPNLRKTEFTNTLSTHILTIGSDISSVQQALPGSAKLKKEYVIKNLDRMSVTLTTIKSQLNHSIAHGYKISDNN